MKKYFLVKHIDYRVVQSEDERQALECSNCPLHSQYDTGTSYIIAGPIESDNIWNAKEILRNAPKIP